MIIYRSCISVERGETDTTRIIDRIVRVDTKQGRQRGRRGRASCPSWISDSEKMDYLKASVMGVEYLEAFRYEVVEL